MTDMFLLSDDQMARILPFFPLSHGVPRVGDRKVISGIIFVICNGLRWRDVSVSYVLHKTIYNRFFRWSELGVFGRIFVELAKGGADGDEMMIDAYVLMQRVTPATGRCLRAASSLASPGGVWVVDSDVSNGIAFTEAMRG
jgi:transposase